jgi:hypothetical protein
MTDGADDGTNKRVKDFQAELDGTIECHRRKHRFDSRLHQFLVIGAALTGFASLGVGLYFTNNSALAGLIGALTSVATVLSQQLHCVKAQNWHERMATEVGGIRTQLLYELKSNPGLDDIAPLAKQLRTLKSKMADEWERVTSTEPMKLGISDQADNSRSG